MSPSAPKRPCRWPGCPEVIEGGGWCDEHKKRHRQADDQRRGSAASRGYGARWRKYSVHFLRLNPTCNECERQGLVVAAEVTDHITPHKGDQDLFWDHRNHQALCKRCHDIKTATEDGGFGR
ncbi:MAG: HNH endonuclease [Desulfobulbaceae bacterium]|nr:HNH endonuclease [Desulfobulbaceae bacterium]